MKIYTQKTMEVQPLIDSIKKVIEDEHGVTPKIKLSQNYKIIVYGPQDYHKTLTKEIKRLNQVTDYDLVFSLDHDKTTIIYREHPITKSLLKKIDFVLRKFIGDSYMGVKKQSYGLYVMVDFDNHPNPMELRKDLKHGNKISVILSIINSVTKASPSITTHHDGFRISF